MGLISQLIQVEDTENLWQPEVRHLHLWTTLRTRVLLSYIQREQNLQSPYAKDGRLSRLYPSLLPKHLQTMYHLLLSSVQPRYDALIFKKARNYFICRYYYERIPAPLVLDKSWKATVSSHAWENQQTVLMDTLTLISSLRSRFIHLTAKEEQQIREFTQHVARVYDMSSQAEIFYAHVKRSVQAAVVKRELLERYVIPRLRGRLALVHQAYYMSRFAILTRTLREHDITVVEPQHGVIYSNHYAYQYSQASLTNAKHPVHLYKPDLFLSFGDFWNEQITIPGDTYTVGYPHLTEKATAGKDISQEKHVLVVSQGVRSEKLASITATLAVAHPKSTFIYKLHPEEIGFPDRYVNLRQLPNVQIIDYQADIHPFIAQCPTIIGFTSTVLFEALAYPNRRIFILESELLDNHLTEKLGTSFTSADDMVDLLHDDTKGHPQFNPTRFWEPEWRLRIDQFLDKYI